MKIIKRDIYHGCDYSTVITLENNQRIEGQSAGGVFKFFKDGKKMISSSRPGVEFDPEVEIDRDIYQFHRIQTMEPA